MNTNTFTEILYRNQYDPIHILALICATLLAWCFHQRAIVPRIMSLLFFSPMILRVQSHQSTEKSNNNTYNWGIQLLEQNKIIDSSLPTCDIYSSINLFLCVQHRSFEYVFPPPSSEGSQVLSTTTAKNVFTSTSLQNINLTSLI